MNNDFLNPENENKNNEGTTPAEEEIYTYTEMPEDVDVFDDSPVATENANEYLSDYDETADVFDRPVCTNPVMDSPVEEASEAVEAEAPTQETSPTAEIPTEEFDSFDTEEAELTEASQPSEDSVANEVSPQPPQHTPYAPQAPATDNPAPTYYVPPTQSVAPATPKYYTPQAPVNGNPVPTAFVPPAYGVAPATPQYTQQAQTPPTKKNKGSTAFLIVLWSLVAIFALGFFGLCGYIIGTSNYTETDPTRPTLFGEESTTAPSEDDSENKPDTTLPSAKPMPEGSELYSEDASLVLNEIPVDSGNAAKYTTSYSYSKVAKSTVGVVCYDDTYSEEEPASEGTGIVLTEDGYIITNSHVIGDSRSLYTVQVVSHDGEKYSAKVIGYDSRTDIAILKIAAENLEPAEICNSKYVEVGQDVIAIGNPGGIGFQNSLTKGIVSAVNRKLDLSAQVSYIQTDAAINPGNSGGPLCNMYGQVIGINTAKISSASYEGMGFAIPSATMKEIADDLIAHGYVSNRVRLGISGQEVSSSHMQYFDLPSGILVGEIVPDGPCDNSGLQINDVITAIDGEDIKSFADVYSILAEHKPGDKVELSVYRDSTGKELKITVTLMADEGETQQ